MVLVTRANLTWTYPRGPEGEETQVGDVKKPSGVPPSRSAEAAAVRWGETHTDEDVAHPAPPNVPEADDVVPNRHSASAEAAALKWHERNDED
jgi:hypothetical protein